MSSKFSMKNKERKYIFVPYKYKDEIKQNGGKYDADKKQWYIYKSNPKYQKIVDIYYDENFNRIGSEYFIKPKQYIMTEHQRIHGF